MRVANLRSALMSAALGAGLLVGLGADPARAAGFLVTNLVSDGSVPALTIDPNLINPWGISSSPTSPFWVSDNNSGVSTLYTGAGAKVPLTVTIAPPTGGSGPATPTGQVFNSSSAGFQVSNGTTSGKAAFIFSTEDGTISGWAPNVDPTHSILAVDNSTQGLGAVYKGLALGNSGGANFLYAADFRNGQIDQYDSSFGLVRAFTDPTVAAGYAPFNAQVLDGHLFVTYALQNDTRHDDVAGAGNGYVDEFNLDGSFNRRLVSLGGEINSPWGLDIAPANFGAFSGDLLVGNFGDGTISAFDPTTGAFAGRLAGPGGDPIVLGDLWGLINGNGGPGADPNKVYFTAGVEGEAHGLFGSISAVPEPATWAMMILGMGMVGGTLRRRAAETRHFAPAAA
jgi:uncharacterized protein (TIGR03118 family)